MASRGQPPGECSLPNPDSASSAATSDCHTYNNRSINATGMNIANVEPSTPFFDDFAYTYMGGAGSPSEGSTMYPIVETTDLQTNQCSDSQIPSKCSEWFHFIFNDLSCLPKDVFTDRSEK